MTLLLAGKNYPVGKYNKDKDSKLAGKGGIDYEADWYDSAMPFLYAFCWFAR